MTTEAVVSQAAQQMVSLAIGVPLLLAAVNIVECVDADGRRMLVDRCSPGTKQVGKRETKVPGKADLCHATLGQLRQTNEPVEGTGELL